MAKNNFLDFISQVDSLRSNYIPDSDKYSPMVVQCRLGDGRTGVFILADLMIAHLQTSTRQVSITYQIEVNKYLCYE